MNQSPSSYNTADTEELVLSLSDPEHLFNAPRIDPLSSSAAEVLGLSGVEHLFESLHLNKKRQRARTLVLLLPSGKTSSTLGTETTRALHSLADRRIEQERLALRNTYRYGWRVTGVALLLLALCLALASLFTSELTEGMRPLLRKTFEYGFEIIGWVILWHPIDVLGFTPLAIRSRIAALQTLARVEVVIRPDPTTKS